MDLPVIDLTALRVGATLLSFVAFIGVWAWAWWPANRSDFEQASRLPFDYEPDQGPNGERR